MSEKVLVEKCKRWDIYHLPYFRIIVDIKDITYIYRPIHVSMNEMKGW